jgi:hypothetical protein
MGDVFSLLGAEHERILALSRELTGGTPAASAAPAERRAIAAHLVAELSRHEAAEEMAFWPLVRERPAVGTGPAAPARPG